MSKRDEIRWVNLELCSADAVVRFDWLMTVDLDSVPVKHPAQKQAPMDLLTCLQTNTRAPLASEDETNAALEQVCRDME